MLDVRVAQVSLENALRDAVWLALGKRLPAVPSVAALRAVATAGATSTAMDDDDLINVVSGGVVVAAYRWSTVSAAADDGAAVIKPTDVSAAGRWLAWTSPLRVELVPGGNSAFLHELLSGVLERVVVLDKDADKDEMTELLLGAVPSVGIDARGDDPADQTQDTGWKWDVDFDFTLYAVTKNLRGQRQAALGSDAPGDSDPGAYQVDGLIWSLLGGTQLYSVLDAVKNVRVGRGANWQSDLAQRRVIRSREYTVRATVENPPAPNDDGPVQAISAQFQLAGAGEQAAVDVGNYVESGIVTALGVGLSKTVSAGVAKIAGADVAYAGELHTFSASADTYRDLSAAGAMTFVEVPNGAEEPAATAGCLRVGVTVTDGAGNVQSDRYVAASAVDFGPDIAVIPTS